MKIHKRYFVLELTKSIKTLLNRSIISLNLWTRSFPKIIRRYGVVYKITLNTILSQKNKLKLKNYLVKSLYVITHCFKLKTCLRIKLSKFINKKHNFLINQIVLSHDVLLKKYFTLEMAKKTNMRFRYKKSLSVKVKNARVYTLNSLQDLKLLKTTTDKLWQQIRKIFWGIKEIIENISWGNVFIIVRMLKCEDTPKIEIKYGGRVCRTIRSE